MSDQLCGSVFHSCCAQRRTGAVAEARKINWDNDVVINTITDDEAFPEVHFGPVVNEPDCGIPKMARRRVVGGASAGFGTFPWQALIRIRASRCGGALIGPRHVVTAGHCVHALGAELHSELPPRGVHVYLGEYSLYNQMEPLPRQRYSVEKIFLHPYYEFTPQADRYDVAVLKLNRKVLYDWHIRPVCLPAKGHDPEPGTVAMVAGWGATEPDSVRRPRELQAVDVNVVQSDVCETWHRANGIHLRVYDDMMCAGHETGGKDACQGDSGGPLMHREATGNWTLIGLVSAGYSCAKAGQPGIYHKLSKSSDWISYVKLHL